MVAGPEALGTTFPNSGVSSGLAVGFRNDLSWSHTPGPPGVGRQIGERPPVLSCRDHWITSCRDHWITSCRDHWITGHSAIGRWQSTGRPATRELDGRTLRWLRLVALDYYQGVASALGCAKMECLFG